MRSSPPSSTAHFEVRYKAHTASSFLPGAMLARRFWLYVWTVTDSSGNSPGFVLKPWVQKTHKKFSQL
jgi:hypothetical protein